MFINFFKIAWRNIQSNKLFTVLNIAGLAFGLCVCIILFAFVSNELAFDGMFKNGKDIYRVNMETTEAYNFEKWAELPNAVGPAMKQDIAQVKSITRLIKDDFGAAFTAEQRTKEIGVRKVLGASVAGIAKLLTKDFLELVAFSFVIAIPVAWWAMSKWLEGFAYRTNIEWWVFVIAGVLALLIALITVSFQAVKAAIANPVESLRSE